MPRQEEVWSLRKESLAGAWKVDRPTSQRQLVSDSYWVAGGVTRMPGVLSKMVVEKLMSRLRMSPDPYHTCARLRKASPSLWGAEQDWEQPATDSGCHLAAGCRVSGLTARSAESIHITEHLELMAKFS